MHNMQQEFQKKDILLAENFASLEAGQRQLENLYRKLNSVLNSPNLKYEIQVRQNMVAGSIPLISNTDYIKTSTSVTIPEDIAQSNLPAIH